MDRMSERLDKQAERLDQTERRVSTVEDGQTALAAGQLKVSTELGTLRHKMDDLESRSRRNNLHIVGIAEFTSIANMENFIENLLIQLLGRDTFSAIFVVAPPRPSIRKRLQLLEGELSQLEQEHCDTADVRILGHIRAKLQEFQETVLSEIQHMGKYAVARAYGEGNRPGRVLANLICPSRSANLINNAVAADGSVTGDPERVATRFHECYQTLYTTKGDPDPNAIGDYLTHIVLPKLSDDDRKALGAPFTLGEIAKALGGGGEGTAKVTHLDNDKIALTHCLADLGFSQTVTEPTQQ
ncbi:hypothetical protein NDU88_006654 [Pleurodeles waltl]|uniref:Uncharacterized protein n=1 Tax=Pleurodeles waltl TaxID=8319 RepID=A0AAV7QLQ7_PLEWA|nr:hypothetical protein NDU88_006654 [Pleurodeles waltl]